MFTKGINMDAGTLFFWILIHAVIGGILGNLEKKKNRSESIWFIAGLILGIWALIVFPFFKPLPKKELTEKKNNE